MPQIHIEPYKETYQDQIINLILNIQTEEFGIAISLKDQPDLEQITSFYQKDNGNFWVALEQDKVVGTIALIDIGNQKVALRKMFVAKEYRGKAFGIAQALLTAVLQWCHQKQIRAIYLGTTSLYFAAHRFYEKNGFKEINATELPKNFPRMQVDNKFYAYYL